MSEAPITFAEEDVRHCPLCHAARGPRFTTCQDDRFGYPGHFHVHACPECGLVFLGSRIRQEFVSALYTRYYQTHSAPTAQRAAGMARAVLPLVRWLYPDTLSGPRVRRFSSAIEIGPGKRPVIDRFGWKGSRYGAVEFDEKAAGFLRHKPEVGAVFSDVASAAEEQGQQRYAVCIADQVLEHVYDPVGFIRQLARLVAPGGAILLGTPNADSRWRSVFADRWIGWHVPYHTMLFNRQSLARLASAAGVELTFVESATPGSWLRLQYRTVGRKMRLWDVLRSTLTERISGNSRWTGDNLCVEFRVPEMDADKATSALANSQGGAMVASPGSGNASAATGT